MRKLFNGAAALLAVTISVIAFVATLFFLRTFGSPLWDEKAAGWAQAIGSVAAIWFAYIFGERQAAAALESVREAERLSAVRQYESILALADSAHKYTDQIIAVFHDGGYSFIELQIRFQDGAILEDLIEALKGIPAHEMGSYNAVLALASLRKAMFDFKGNMHRVLDGLEQSRNPENNSYPSWSTWNSTALQLCVEQIRRSIKGLRDHRPAFTK